MSTTLDLIKAIEAGNSRTSLGVFEELAQERVAAAIDQRRGEISANMFAVEEAVIEDDGELTEEKIHALSEEDFAALVEDYEQLDELSKGTLASYVKKANSSGGLASFRQGKAVGNAGAFSKRPDKVAAKENAKISDKRTKGIHTAVDKLSK